MRSSALPGIHDAFIVRGSDAGAALQMGLVDGVAIVADRYWQAEKALQQLEVQWEQHPTSTQSTARLRARGERPGAQQAAADPASRRRRRGGLEAVGQGGAGLLCLPVPGARTARADELHRRRPSRRHRRRSGRRRRDPRTCATRSRATLGIEPEKVKVHMTRAGGGFGRRGDVDYAIEAAIISKMAGCPIKLLWNRRQDIQHDAYRPAGYHNFTAGLDAQGRVIAFRDHFVTFAQRRARSRAPRTFRDNQYPAGFVPHLEYAQSLMQLGVPTGYLRNPGNNGLAFAYESSSTSSPMRRAGSGAVSTRLAGAAARDPCAEARQATDAAVRYRARARRTRDGR